MKKERGFTLIELMIVVVLIGVIAGIAYPSYRKHMVKTNRAAAQGYMMSLSTRQEQIMLDQRGYLAATSAQLTAGTPPTGLIKTPDEVSRYYNVTITVNATPPSYSITATPISGKAQTNDGTLTLASDGTKSPTDKWK